MKRWTPRASSIGAYLLCDYRAALDRAISEQLIPAPALPQDPKPYADLGSCIHARLQTILGCVSPDPIVLQPEHVASAAVLFGGDPVKTLDAIEAAARFAALTMPKTPDGLPWKSEFKYKYKSCLTGHIDFVSQDGTVIVDLKTTARKPDHHRMKAEHAAQLCAYRLMVPTATKGYVLYVDSTRANWALLTDPLDFTAPEVVEYLNNLAAFAARLKRKTIFGTAMPRLGSHCQATFCPYASICRDKIIPAATMPVDAAALVTPSMTGPL